MLNRQDQLRKAGPVIFYIGTTYLKKFMHHQTQQVVRLIYSAVLLKRGLFNLTILNKNM